jgi:hypothetical protein
VCAAEEKGNLIDLSGYNGARRECVETKGVDKWTCV